MSNSLWEEKEDTIADLTKKVMTGEHKFVGDEVYALPIYALLTQMHTKKRRSFDGTFYYINLSKRILRVPHTYRADRCSIVEGYHSVPDMYRMIETAVMDLGPEPAMAPLKQEMIVLRDRVETMKKTFSDEKRYPYSELDNQLDPIAKKIEKKYGLKDGSFRAPSERTLKWEPPEKDQTKDMPDLEFSLHCSIETFRKSIKADETFSPIISWDFKVEKNDNPGALSPLELVGSNCPNMEEFTNLREQFRTMSIETYEQYRAVYREYNKKVQEFETELADTLKEYKRVYDTYCAASVKEILLVQDFDAII
jgi:hypothetical protein